MSAAPETLSALGWNGHFAAQTAPEPGVVPARVILESKLKFRVQVPGAHGVVETWADVAGRMRHRAANRRDFPAVGDWVWLRLATDGDARIEAILKRTALLVRTGAGETGDPQPLAANVDVAFIVTSLNRDLNPRRLERYAALVRSGGVEPVILLTKCDLADASFAAQAQEQVSEACPGIPVLAISAHTGEGLERLLPYLAPGRTLVLLGSSGVGKSTLVNRLLGEDTLAVQEVSGDEARGRHTTSARQMLRLPGGALLIDTPGMRELRLPGESAEGVESAFAEIDRLAQLCRFRDCHHESEPGCAVREAVTRGELGAERLESYRKLSREAEYAARRDDKALQAQHARSGKRIAMAVKRMQKNEE